MTLDFKIRAPGPRTNNYPNPQLKSARQIKFPRQINTIFKCSWVQKRGTFFPRRNRLQRLNWEERGYRFANLIDSSHGLIGWINWVDIESNRVMKKMSQKRKTRSKDTLRPGYSQIKKNGPGDEHTNKQTEVNLYDKTPNSAGPKQKPTWDWQNDFTGEPSATIFLSIRMKDNDW